MCSEKIIYDKRFYRDWTDSAGLEHFQVTVGQSDLLVACKKELQTLASRELRRARRKIELYIAKHQEFAGSLVPVCVGEDAPDIVLEMEAAAAVWNVGPMAAVAGAVAQAVGRRLCLETDTVIVENGGDIFAKAPRALRFAIYAGEDSPFSDKLAFEMDAREGVGVCTSSGRVGPSLSFGLADAVVAIDNNVPLADAAATAIANRVRSSKDVQAVVEEEKEKARLRGLIVCCGDRFGAWGDFEIVKR